MVSMTTGTTATGRDTSGPAPLRVGIVSGSFGAGHDVAAREIAQRLAAVGIETDVLDIVDFYPGRLGSVARAVYYAQMRSAPRTWGWLLRLFDDGSATEPRRRPVHRLARRGTAPRPRQRERWGTRGALWLVAVLGAALRDVVREHDGVIATHPFAAQTLGRLRRRGELAWPAATYLTDLSVHRLWVAPGIDAHLALHKVAAEAAQWHGAELVRVVRPAVRRSTPLGPVSRPECRRRLGLPDGIPLALVTGGAEGIGELSRAAEDLLATGLVHPVVLCGRDETLRARLAGRADLTALGWVDDMAVVYAAVDLLVQNAGGSTSLEGLEAGLPMLSYRCLPGHGETNAAALDLAGLAPWVRTPEDLRAAVEAALARGPSEPLPGGPDVWRDAPDVGVTFADLLAGRP